MTHDLDKLEKLAMAATPGPWVFERQSFDSGDFAYERNDDHGMIQIYEHNYKDPMRAKFDADYIAATNPATILALCKALREAEKGLELIKGEVANGNMRFIADDTLARVRAAVEMGG
jgi:hypothetical protein